MPMTSIVLLTALSLVSLLPGQPTPLFGLIALHYWAARRPDLVPAAGVFAVGLIHDGASDAPVGLMALIYLLVLGASRGLRHQIAGMPFGVGLGLFAALAVVSAALVWVVVSFHLGAPMSMAPTIGLFLFTVIAYPPLVLVLAGIGVLLPAGDD